MKKVKINKAFSLIEVIVASIILSLAVFWVFKLIWEYEKIINNSDNYKTATSLFIPFEECLKYNSNSSNNFYVNISDCTNSTIEIINIIDNKDYILYWETTDDINYILQIEVSWLKIEKTYIK